MARWHSAGVTPLIYLASPYSHPDDRVRQARFEAACRTAAELMRQGHVVFSPIAHSHGIAKYGLPLDWRFWERHDRRFLEVCDALAVLALDGWRESVGVHAEMQIARELEKPIRFLSQDGRMNEASGKPLGV
jgi:nucleoside 2-deoxyribosyltransferase